MKVLKTILIILAVAAGIWILFFSGNETPEQEMKRLNNELEDAVNNLGYYDVDEFVREYARNDLGIEEVFDREEIMDEAIGMGWIYDYVYDNPEEFSFLLEQ